jgi:hypothetical protein
MTDNGFRSSIEEHIPSHFRLPGRPVSDRVAI